MKKQGGQIGLQSSKALDLSAVRHAGLFSGIHPIDGNGAFRASVGNSRAVTNLKVIA